MMNENGITTQNLDEVLDISSVSLSKLISIQNGVKELIFELEISAVDKELKITELASILGITDIAIHRWNIPEIKSGVRMSFVLGFLEKEKPKYAEILIRYIKKEAQKKLNQSEYKKTGS